MDQLVGKAGLDACDRSLGFGLERIPGAFRLVLRFKNRKRPEKPVRVILRFDEHDAVLNGGQHRGRHARRAVVLSERFHLEAPLADFFPDRAHRRRRALLPAGGQGQQDRQTQQNGDGSG